MNEWCEHMGYSPKASWLFCPNCGAKRPPERKKLAEELNRVCGWSDQINFNVAAKVAIDAVIEVYEKWAEESSNKTSYLDVTAFPDYLKKELL